MSLTPHVRACRALVDAARHYDNPRALVDAVQIHCTQLTRDELVAVTALLAGALSMAHGCIDRLLESAEFGNITAEQGAHDPDGNPPS